ncbi:MAG: hypothetical protein AAF004_13435 [Pseudomonadota bacterium]
MFGDMLITGLTVVLDEIGAAVVQPGNMVGGFIGREAKNLA